MSLLDLRHFDYDQGSPPDDFDAIVETMPEAPAVLFATPVYWYAMSGRMKTLFDRFTDLLRGRDPAGRGARLTGRAVWLLGVGADPEAPEGFAVPFERTAGYLGMMWSGKACVSTAEPSQWEPSLMEFAGRIADAPR